jgi:hypothetical protein
MDSNRHQSDSEAKYKLHYKLLHSKIQEYNVEARHTYNIDEKGFMIGVTGSSKRIFSRRLWEEKEFTASLQDSSPEWITLLAAICADGGAPPPGLIYQAAKGNIQSSWAEDINVGKHQIFVSSSLSGWTNNDVGLAWLEQVLDRHTKKKARQSYRLLILDGYWSYVTMDSIDYCNNSKTLLATFPPHSTHTLQPLDVVKPLSSAYSTELSRHLHKSQELIPIKKGDFFPLFWEIWIISFKKEPILKSFEATGISPANADVILKRFAHPTPDEQKPRESSSRLSPSDWRQMDRLIRAAVEDNAAEEGRKLSVSLHYLQVHNELLQHENKRLREALTTKRKHKKKGKVLNLKQRQEYHGGAVFWSPRKVREARAREAVREQLEKEERRPKAEAKDLKAAATLFKQNIAEEKRVARDAAKTEREKEKVEKVEQAAERQRQKEAEKQAAAGAKALQLSQRGKRPASKQLARETKRVKTRSGVRSGSVVPQAAPPPPPKTTRRGRNVKLPSKYR